MKHRTADWIFFLLFFLTGILSAAIVYYTPLDLSPDEAHYWEWSRKLDYAYYSKGPVIAYLIAISVKSLGDTSFAVRLPALICSLSFSLVFYFFLRRQYGSVAALLAWLCYRVTLVFAAQYFAITTDPPVALFWLIALIFLYRAVYMNQSIWFVPGFIMVGLATLTKYTAIILYPSILSLCILSPKLRTHLRSQWFWWASASLGVTLLPIYFWNIKHDWVNFQHNAGHLSAKAGFKFVPGYFLELIAGQLGLVGPIIFPIIIYSLWHGWRRFREGDNIAGLFTLSALPLLTVCIVISFIKRIYANWPMPAFIGGLLLVTHSMCRSTQFHQKLKGFIKPAIAVNILITLLVHLPVMGITLGIPGKFLTTKKLVGWNELGKSVDLQLEKQASDIFLLTDGYGMASEIAFYSKFHPEVFCANLTNRRMNQYDVWDGWEQLKDRDALIVIEKLEAIENLRPHFAEIIEIPEASFAVKYSGELLRKVYFFLGRKYDGYVFWAEGR